MKYRRIFILIAISITPHNITPMEQNTENNASPSMYTHNRINRETIGSRLSYCSYYPPQHLCNTIINNPKEALGYIYNIQQALNEEQDQLLGPNSTDYELFKQILTTYEQHCPIFSLGECSTEDFWWCTLSREHDSTFRKQFESEVVSALQSKLAHGKPVQYVGFGSGGQFQDLVIMAQTLQRVPKAHISIHVIDSKYHQYSLLHERVHKKRDIDPSDDMLSEKAINTAIQADYEYIPEEKIKEAYGKYHRIYVSQGLLAMDHTHKQFIRFLKDQFPHAHLTFALHKDADTYQQYLHNTDTQYPDVIAAADIDDEMSIVKNSIPNYSKLCLKAQQHNPESYNYLLRKDGNHAHITQLSVHEQPNGTKEQLPKSLAKELNISYAWIYNSTMSHTETTDNTT